MPSNLNMFEHVLFCRLSLQQKYLDNINVIKSKSRLEIKYRSSATNYSSFNSSCVYTPKLAAAVLPCHQILMCERRVIVNGKYSKFIRFYASGFVFSFFVGG